ncbi:unnamed protein product [Ectocarpus sp. 4 AP-2014]
MRGLRYIGGSKSVVTDSARYSVVGSPSFSGIRGGFGSRAFVTPPSYVGASTALLYAAVGYLLLDETSHGRVELCCSRSCNAIDNCSGGSSLTTLNADVRWMK